jgi:CubicO group peptidase (beta-lactamase class C family)/Skp family chaperone for outer membrane proteins
MLALFRFTLVLAAVLQLSLGTHGQSASSTLEKQIDQVFQEFVRQDDFQGAVLVGHQGKILYEKAFGLANREWDIPNTVDTKFNLASISKQFTAALVLQLVEEGHLDLNNTISDYFPEYRRDVGQRVTLHQLLTHQSGIPNYTSLPFVWSDSLYRRYDSQELIQKFVSGDLEFEPGTRYQYNNSGYLILSYIIEEVTGQPFEEVLDKRIIRPLGLKNTGVDEREVVLSQRAYGYHKTSAGYQNVYSMYMPNLQGAGNLYGTIGDLYRWDQSLYNNSVLSENSRELMMRPYTNVNQQWITPYENRYGFGVGLAKIPLGSKGNLDMVFHSGHIRGFSGFYARYPDEQYAVIILSNTGEVSTARMNQLNLEVIQLLESSTLVSANPPSTQSKSSQPSPATTTPVKRTQPTPVTTPISERDLEKAMYSAWVQGGASAAIAQYNQLTESFPYDYADTRKELSALTKKLNKEGNTESALAIAELNSRVNPHWESFSELAAIHQQLGQKENAVQHYQRAISINPNRTEEEQAAYQNAQEALKTLL